MDSPPYVPSPQSVCRPTVVTPPPSLLASVPSPPSDVTALSPGTPEPDMGETLCPATSPSGGADAHVVPPPPVGAPLNILARWLLDEHLMKPPAGSLESLAGAAAAGLHGVPSIDQWLQLLDTMITELESAPYPTYGMILQLETEAGYRGLLPGCFEVFFELLVNERAVEGPLNTFRMVEESVDKVFELQFSFTDLLLPADSSPSARAAGFARALVARQWFRNDMMGERAFWLSMTPSFPAEMLLHIRTLVELGLVSPQDVVPARLLCVGGADGAEQSDSSGGWV